MKALLCHPIAIFALSLTACVTEQQPSPVAEAEPIVEAVPDWQATLIDDLETVEAKGDLFLDGAFKLYDQLLSEDPMTPERQAQLDIEVKASAGRYADLVQAIANLKTDLAKAEIKASLPLAGQQGDSEYAAVNELFTFYKHPTNKPGPYDPNQGESVTKMLFQGSQMAEESGLESLPKQQRDALMLLDYLRLISNDLAYVSSTVTDWIDLEGKDLEAFAH